MATFDEAFSAAQRLLSESGMLVDGQLLNLADGDKTVARQIREALIESGLAEDRYGVALARASNQSSEHSPHRPIRQRQQVDPSSEIVFAAVEEESSDTASDWWLMSGGVTSGPFDFPTLRQMRGRGEIIGSALVRHTQRGTWQRPEEIAGLADVSDHVSPAKPVPQSKRTSTAPAAMRSRVADRIPAPQSAELDRETSVDRFRRTDQEVPAIQRPAKSTTGKTEYFLWDQGKAAGPIYRDELEDRLRGGRLTAEDFVQVGREGDWQPVSVALSGQRPPLGPQISAGIRGQSLVGNQVATDDISRSSSSHEIQQISDGTSGRINAASSVNAMKTGSGKSLGTTATMYSKIKPSTNPGRSSIVTCFDRASELVGGKGRLQTILVSLTSVVALLVWWQQPPSASRVYAALDDCHQIVIVVGQQKIRGTDSSPDLARAEIRVRSIRDGLKKRASSQRPAEQELLWACEYGLLPLIKENAVSPEGERAYMLHMSRAQRLIDPGKGQKIGISVSTDQRDSVQIEPDRSNKNQ